MNAKIDTGYWVVTGGAGFIGSHTVDRLLEEDRRVVVLDDFSTGRRENLAHHADNDHLLVIDVDVCDGFWAPLSQVPGLWGRAQTIIHLAAQTAVTTSVDNPIADVRSNYQATVAVLEYARHEKVHHVSFASSAAVYGDCNELPLREESARWPLSPYGVNKLGSEQFMAAYAAMHGLNTVATRFFNVYGPRQDPSSPYSGVISIFIERALKDQNITIFGDGRQTRDFVYVEDVARALIASASRGLSGHRSMNIGTQKATSVLELASIIREVCHSKSEIDHASARTGEITDSLADVSQAREWLDFEARLGLAEGLAHTVKWYQSEP